MDHEVLIGEALAESTAWARIEAGLPAGWLVALELHTVPGAPADAIEWHVVARTPANADDPNGEYVEEWRSTGPTRRIALVNAADAFEAEGSER